MDKRINHNQEGNIIVPGKYLILSDQLLGDVDFQDVFLREGSSVEVTKIADDGKVHFQGQKSDGISVDIFLDSETFKQYFGPKLQEEENKWDQMDANATNIGDILGKRGQNN